MLGSLFAKGDRGSFICKVTSTHFFSRPCSFLLFSPKYKLGSLVPRGNTETLGKMACPHPLLPSPRSHFASYKPSMVTYPWLCRCASCTSASLILM